MGAPRETESTGLLTGLLATQGARLRGVRSVSCASMKPTQVGLKREIGAREAFIKFLAERFSPACSLRQGPLLDCPPSRHSRLCGRHTLHWPWPTSTLGPFQNPR